MELKISFVEKYIFVSNTQKYGILFIEISYLLTDYLGFGYTISSYHKEICSRFILEFFIGKYYNYLGKAIKY